MGCTWLAAGGQSEPHATALDVHRLDSTACGEPGHALRIPVTVVRPPVLVHAGTVREVAAESVDLDEREFDDRGDGRAEGSVQRRIAARYITGLVGGGHVLWHEVLQYVVDSTHARAWCRTSGPLALLLQRVAAHARCIDHIGEGRS